MDNGIVAELLQIIGIKEVALARANQEIERLRAALVELAPKGDENAK